MKSLYRIFPFLIVSPWSSHLNAQEIVTKWDVEIPGPLADGTPSAPVPKPAPLDLCFRRDRGWVPELRSLGSRFFCIG
jgi:hypothetical protein